MRKFTFLSIITCAMLCSTQCFSQAASYKITKTFTIGGEGGWDYIAISPVHKWLYVSHSSKVQVIDKTNGDSVAVIENTAGIHGICFDAAASKGFTSNGRSNTVTVFDLNTNKTLAEINVGKDPDAILYDTYSKKVITCNGRNDNLSIIDPITNMVTDSVAVAGVPETAVSNGKGLIFVNIENKNEVVVVNSKTFKVVDRWSLGKAEGPTGLAMDIKTNRLFVGCDKKLVIMNALNGTIINTIKIGDGCDGVGFDTSTKNIFTSNGEGTVSVIHEGPMDKFSLVQTVKTKRSARTIAVDEVSHNIYLPAADLEPMAAGQTGRPKIKKGTFQVLVLNKN